MRDVNAWHVGARGADRVRLHRRHTPIVQLVVGGVNADWAEGADEMRKQLQEELEMGPAGAPSAR